MDACCTSKGEELERLWAVQSRTLSVVLFVNATMFLVELVFGLLAHSLALLADSLDMLTDALVYGLSLYVVYRGTTWKVRAALAKAVVMALSGIFVLSQLAYRLAYPQVPVVQTMGLVGAAALLANAFCFFLLWRHRAEDLNMRSVWLCSRNDLIANTLVLAATFAVWGFSSAWPDIFVGIIISALFLRSAIGIGLEAQRELANESHRVVNDPQSLTRASSCCDATRPCGSTSHSS